MLPHINKLELLTVLLAIRSFAPVLQGHSVAVLSDNTTAVSYINRQGGTVSRSLCKLALRLWDFCLANDIFPATTHVPGDNNTLADALSRDLSSCHEWELNDQYLTPIFHTWGKPTLDAFATTTNAKCEKFCSRGGRDQKSVGDGLLFDWMNHSVYAFPPLPLILRVLQKLLDCPTLTLLVTPWWLRQPWFPLLLQLSHHTYYKFPLCPDLLILRTAADAHLQHHNVQSLSLTIWNIYS